MRFSVRTAATATTWVIACLPVPMIAELVGTLGRHARGGDAGDPAGAHLAERKGLDDGFELAGVAVPQRDQRRRAARGVRPGLGADRMRAFDHGADGVQRVMAAPDLMGLGHVARGPGGFEREAFFQRLDRFGERKRGDHILLGDPERLAHPAAPAKIEGTGGARSSAFTM